MKISVIGTGYVGLVTGTCFSDFGNNVICLDIDENKIKMLKSGKSPIYEPGLEAIILKNFNSKRLEFTSDPKVALSQADVIFIAVGTPSASDGSADLTYVKEAAATIGRYMKTNTVVVNKSTVPIGTADIVREIINNQIKERNERIEFGVASNPEFLKEGSAVDDFMRPDRVILGVDTDRAAKVLKELYNPIVRNHDRVILMDIKSAEMTKYAANSMLATRISFMNELSQLAEKVGADIEKVRIGIGSDSRIGYSFLYAGCGYGGSCFPKDVKALINTAEKFNLPSRIISAVEEVNKDQKKILFEKIKNYFNGNLKGITIALWGLAFKPNTDDIREAPSLTLIAELTSAGAKIQAYDPIANDHVQDFFGTREDIKYYSDQISVLDGADVLVLVTEWKEFRSPDLSIIKSKLKKPAIFDGRNQYDKEMVRDSGVEYFSIGR